MPDQLIRRCCIDRLNGQRLSESGLGVDRFPLSGNPIDQALAKSTDARVVVT